LSSAEIDSYLESVELAYRETLGALRTTILKVVPDALEEISYRIPAFRVEGGIVAGFATFTHHMSYFPFSGSVLGQLAPLISGYSHTKSALHFTPDTPLSDALVERLIATRLTEIRERGH
jgi:uncharacterized protein YdhG (YjbR/CyaY superfamily)